MPERSEAEKYLISGNSGLNSGLPRSSWSSAPRLVGVLRARSFNTSEFRVIRTPTAQSSEFSEPWGGAHL
eukprot:2329516-Alexandrium_andersonii.AAC.1